MKKALSIVLSTILLLALLVVPAQAADAAELNLPVTQTVTLEGEGAKAEDAVVDYTFTAVTAGAPMPAGADGGDYSFQLIGNEEYQIPTITYTSTGKWQYLLTAEGSDVDPQSVDITVYVTRQDGELLAVVVAINPDGDKCDLTFTATAKGEEEPITHTVIFETGEGSDVDDQVVNDGDTATEPEDPTWDGHTFEGWYLDEDCTIPYDFSTPVTEDITLYAKWEEIDEPEPPGPVPPEPVTYTVTFDLGDGTIYTEQTVEEGDTATKPQDPSKEGYTFEGWYLDEDCTIPYDFNTPVTGDITLYAKWTKVVEPEPVPTGEFQAWSLMNLICAVMTAAIGGAMMATVGRNRRRILGLLPMIASAAIFLLYEHMSLPMQLCDKFTPLMVGLLAVNMILAYLTSGKTAEERSGDSD